MKKSSYFSALVLTAGLISSAIVFGLNSKDVKEEKGAQPQAVKTQGSTESAWLNTKNFPTMQQSSCPFYIVVKPGC